MKQILIIGGKSTVADDVAEIKAFAAGVRQAAGSQTIVDHTHLDALYVVCAPDGLQIIDVHSQKQLSDYQLIVLRSKMRTYAPLGYCLSLFCKAQNIDFFNDYSHYFSGGKIEQALLFQQLQVPFLRTIFALDHQTLLQAVKRQLQPPFILKDNHGAHGNTNYLVHSFVEAADILARHPQVAFIAQAFCPNDRDYRVLILGNKQLIFERVGSADSHLNNTSQGARAQLAPHAIPKQFIQDARRIMQAMQLSIAGVDIIPDSRTGQLYFLEINAQPQIFTGALLDEKAALFQQFLKQRLD